MASAGLARRTGRAWRRLNFEQRLAGIGALLLLVSTFGPFSWVEAAEIVVALGVLALLYARSQGQRFHLPFGDGVVVAVSGIWAGLLTVIRLFERPLGQNMLALICAGILVLAGLREHAKRPADDLPTERLPADDGEEEPTVREPGPAAGEGEPAGGEGEPASAGGGGASAQGQPHEREAGRRGDQLDDRGHDQRLG
jgi:hypothetical protein